MTAPRPGEPVEQRLRDALLAEAGRVGFDHDALSVIQTRTRERTWWHRIRGGVMPFALTGGAATAVAATLTSVILTVGSCTPPPPDPDQPGSTSSPATTGAPATGSPTPTGSVPPAPTSTDVVAKVPIYYIGSVATQPKLYREYHRVPAGTGSAAAKTKAAITQMLDGRTAFDHDYISSWPASASVRNVSVSGDTVTVDLSGAVVNAYDPPSEKAALQQLIWTATAASDTTGFKLLLDGKTVDKLWNLLPVGGTLRRGSAVDVLAPVWVIDPQQGAALSPGQATIFVAGIVFEATMRVRVTSSTGTVVLDKSVLLSAGPPSQGTATLKTPALAPGTYTVEGFYLSAKDGSVQGMDNHTFTVR